MIMVMLIIRTTILENETNEDSNNGNINYNNDDVNDS